MKIRALSAAWVVPVCAAFASDSSDRVSGNSLALFNSYLAQAAVVTSEYRADLRPGGDPARMPAGRCFGRSPILGSFTYRPKTYDELSLQARAALLREPKFHEF